MSNSKNTSEIIDHFFRHESAKVISFLAGKYGTKYLELAEDAVQDSLLKAMSIWPFKGVPDNPTGWLVRVSQNKMLDQIRRDQLSESKKEVVQEFEVNKESSTEVVLDHQLNDDFLNMMFACCHPSISTESQIILVLKILCGFGNKEIAKALMKTEDAVAKSYTRAKAKLKSENIKLEVPIGKHLNKRLDVILKIVYLMFNEGYNSMSSDKLVQQDVCYEAMRLTKILIDHPLLNKPNVNAIMALMCFQASRFETRLDEKGNLITLDKQDRSKWNRELIDQGGYHLFRSTRFGEVSSYYLEARIAACHAIAPSFEETNWKQILHFYDQLMQIKGGHVVALNRLVSYAKVHGPKKALFEIKKLAGLEDNYLYHAIQGSFYEDLNDQTNAMKEYEKAILLTNNLVEKNHLKNKILVITSV